MEVGPRQIRATEPLQVRYLTPQYIVAVCQQARLVHSLQTHESLTHSSVIPPLQIPPPVRLDHQRALARLQKLSSLRPPTNTLLQHENLPGQRLLPQLLQIHVLGIFKEHFSFTQLVVSSTQHGLADPSRRSATVLFVRGLNTIDKEAVTIDKVAVGVADRVAGASNPDRFHHARVAKLTHDQLTVEGHRLLVLVGLDTAHKEGRAGAQGLHE